MWGSTMDAHGVGAKIVSAISIEQPRSEQRSQRVA